MEKPRKTGIPVIPEVRWGSHICLFYQTPEESLSVLVPFFAAGLGGNEFCVWVVPDERTKSESLKALRGAVKDLDARLSAGQIELLTADQWYVRDGEFVAEPVLNGWAEKFDQAIKKGYDGSRVCGDTSWLSPGQWLDFADYEVRIGDLLDKSRAMAICAYNLDKCEASGVIDVVSTHAFAIIKRGKEWQLIENAERKRALETVREMEERYRRTVSNIPVAVYSVAADEDFSTIMVTDKITDMLGYAANEFLDDPGLYAKIVHEEDRAAVMKSLVEHKVSKTPYRLEYRLIAKDGSVRWIKDEAAPVMDDDGEMIRFDGFVEDVTDLKEAEDALRYSEERYDLAQRAAKIGSWDWDIATGKLVWSDEIEPMFGFKKGGFAGTYEAFLSVVHPEDRKFLEDSVAACVEKGDRYDIEHRIVWTDGSLHWMSEAGDVIRDDAGKAIRMLGVVRDITVKKSNEERIERLNKELDASNKELEAFCYSVSHDLRAPLNRIDGFSQLLLDDISDKLDDKGKTYLSRIRASTKNMNQLIDDLLRLSRITTADISREEVNLTLLARTIANRLGKSDPTRKVHFSMKETPPVHGDRHLLEIAVGNLMENAWKFTGKRPVGEIEFGAEVKDGQDVYFVRDNGVGFDMNYVPKLFEPFQRLPSGEEFPGTGIGLAIVQRVISRHQGKIWAEGQPDKGATFYFTLGNGANTEPAIN